MKVEPPSTSSQPSSSGSPRVISGLENTLRVRFGDIDQIELGELIGRGGEPSTEHSRVFNNLEGIPKERV